jgi:hypothetical protein
MRERKRREGARTYRERQGAWARARPSWARPGWVASRVKISQHTQPLIGIPNAKRNPQRDKTNARLNMTSNKRDMLRHDATPMTT